MITSDSITLQGVPLGPENPLPRFKAPGREHNVQYDTSFTQADRELFAYETGYRVLPYRMQDSYTRCRGDMTMETVTLENENLKALFYPQFGGRLASLFDKKRNRELLFHNPVFQPANLAIRDAWFSGGIEWNIGVYGHSPLTCSPLFFGKIKDDEGHEILRAWEYERCRNIFFSLDFHLPPGAAQLAVHVRIVNDNPTEVPMYWWTNIAVPETEATRIFSSADEVIYIKQDGNLKEGNVHEFGRSKLTDLPSLPGRDPSYPSNFEFSSEYFFQTEKETESPWEAATLPGNSLFFERSTRELRYRKMFCWGVQKGGRHWCDFLSEPGRGSYLEIQAGLAPTQVHGLRMPGNSSWSFTQFFGCVDTGDTELNGVWPECRDRVDDLISSALSPAQVDSFHRKASLISLMDADEILFTGSGWGALEKKRRSDEGRPLPEGFIFPDSSLTSEQTPWLRLLETGTLPEHEGTDFPVSYMTDPRWRGRLEKSCSAQSGNVWDSIHLGILLYENDEKQKALELWKSSLERNPTVLACRNLSHACAEKGERELALRFMNQAVSLSGNRLTRSLCEEQLKLLMSCRLYREAWTFFSELKAPLATEERILSLAAIAAYETAHFDFLETLFHREFASVKEGETRIVDLWYGYHAQRLAHIRNTPLNEELMQEARNLCPPPEGIDFRMS